MYSKDFEKGYLFGYILSTKDSLINMNITDEQIHNIINQIFTSFNITPTNIDYNNAVKIHDKCEKYGKNLMDGA